MKLQKKIEKQQARKKLHSLKAPVSKAKKQLENLSLSIKCTAKFVIALLLFIFLWSYCLIYDNPQLWKTSSITFNEIYDASYTRVKGGKVTRYYICDSDNVEYKITWSDFKVSTFKEDMLAENTLHIVWHWWFGEKLVVAMEGENVVYKSYDDAIKDSHEDGVVMIIFLAISIIIELFLIRHLYSCLKEKRKTEAELIDAEEKLSNYINEQ